LLQSLLFLQYETLIFQGFGGFGVPQPFFIRSVPKKRISEIMNWIEEEDQEGEVANSA